MPVPTGRLAAATAFLSLAVLVLPWRPGLTLLVVDGALVAVAGVDWLAAVRPASLGLRRSVPAIVTLGERAELEWSVSNPSRRTVRATLTDRLVPSLRASTRRFRVTVTPGAAGGARATLAPQRRGRFVLGEVTVRVAGPLGLVARQVRRAVPGTLRVYPAFASRKEAELRLERARVQELGLRSARGRGGGTAFEALREYGPDDDFRRIDWAATARRDVPIVHTYRAERNQRVLLLLDCGRVMAGRCDGVPRLEHAMDAALLITVVAGRLGDRVGLLAFDDDVRAAVGPAAGGRPLPRITEAMYQLEPSLVESDYRGAFARTLAQWHRRALLVLFTELTEAAVEEGLLPALPLIARDHVVVIAAVRDPAVEAWSGESPTDAAIAYRRAAASAALEERRRTVARLRALGAAVVDAEPGRLAPELADAYLDLKATGRL